jgi:hypothetical protein
MVVHPVAAQAPSWKIAWAKQHELRPISATAVPISTVPGQRSSRRKSISGRTTTEVAPDTCSSFSAS